MAKKDNKQRARRWLTSFFIFALFNSAIWLLEFPFVGVGFIIWSIVAYDKIRQGL